MTKSVDAREINETSLKEIVSKHKLCWEVWPEFLQDSTGRRQIGFEMNLIGTHYKPEHPPSPGCDECVSVYNDLRLVAEWIIPKEKRESSYEIGPFDSSMRFARIRKSRPDVTLVMKVLHRYGFDAPVDACEILCLDEMEKRLRELGAQKGGWHRQDGTKKDVGPH